MSVVAAVEVRAALPRDAEDIRRLLAEAGLPTEDLHRAADRRMWVADHDGRPIGAIGLERYGDTGLLRSLVVTPARRGLGYGLALVEALERAGRAAGLDSLVLLTETAEPFFRRLGYAVVDRASVPEAVRSSTEFRSVCPASAVCMSKRLT
jgi:amino-acid N-acetyltransferase